MLNKQEKERLAAIERAYWKDEAMVKHCVGSTTFLYELRGKLIPVEKCSIKKDFCFGYSLSRYDTESYDGAAAMARHAAESQKYFIRENHGAYAGIIEALNDHWTIAYARPHYCGNCPDLYSIQFERCDRKIPDDAFILTDEEKQAYKLVLVKAIKEHHKKIMTYLKKYGLSEVNTWTYWQDE